MSHAEPDVAGTVFDETGSELSRSYARALIGASETEGRVDAVLDELDELIADVWTDRPDFVRLLESPVVSQADRDRILVSTFEGRADPLIVRYLRVLNRHERLGLLTAIARQARVIRERQQGRKRVRVRSAVPLDDGQQAALRGKLAMMIAAEPIVHFEVDPSLIGGLLVQVGDELYDASIRAQLQTLRRRLLEEYAMGFRGHRDAFMVSE